MSESAANQSVWDGGSLPAGVVLGRGVVIRGTAALRRFRSQHADGLTVGESSTLDGVQLSVGPQGRISIGRFCCLTNAILMCDEQIKIGNYVLIGWNVVIADTDFHPLAPAQRVADAVACSPIGKDRSRPSVECRPVHIGSDVFIGPNATILKGVRIGDGAWIEPGSVVTRDVAVGAHVGGNPAKPVTPQDGEAV
ncbi:MAG: acyltransferase [Phycisphaerae bacterium]